MDDIQGKIEFMHQLKAKGVTGEALEKALYEYDLLDETQQEEARSALAQLQLQDLAQVPDVDIQDNQKNIEAAQKLAVGTYDPERDSTAPPSMRSASDQRTQELYQSMGIADPGVGKLETIDQRAQDKPEVDRSKLIVRGSSILKPPKVKP